MDSNDTGERYVSYRRTFRLSPRIRRHFGPLFGGETTIKFRPDGTVRVTVHENAVELTEAEANAFDE